MWGDFLPFLNQNGKFWDCYKFAKHRPSGSMLSISWFDHVCVSMCVCLSVCAFTFEVPFKRLFSPTSRSRMSTQIWKLLLTNGVKSHRKKFLFSGKFCLTKQDSFGIGVSHSVYRSFAPTSQPPMSKLFRFSESLGKSNGNKWSQIWKLLLIRCKIAAQFFSSLFFRQILPY